MSEEKKFELGHEHNHDDEYEPQGVHEACGHDCEHGCCSSEEEEFDCCGHESGEHFELHGGPHHKIWKFILMLVALIMITGVIVVSILRDRIVSQQFRQVTITGQGKVSYQPDIAIVTLGVQIDKAPKAEDALAQLNNKVNGIISAVKAAGVNDENIQTQNYSVMPQYDFKDNVSVVGGYNANQQLTVKIVDYDKDQAKLNRVITAASKAGVNQILNLSFDSSYINNLKQQARVKAIADAKSKSGELAYAAGVQLKDISGWYENLVQAPVPYYSNQAMGSGMGGGGGVPQVPSGSREIIIEIGVTYNLK